MVDTTKIYYAVGVDFYGCKRSVKVRGRDKNEARWNAEYVLAKVQKVVRG